MRSDKSQMAYLSSLLLLLPLLLAQPLRASPLPLAPISASPLSIRGKLLPIPAAEAKATVLIFISSTCPIANVYAAEINRIHNTYVPKGVAFRLVYTEPGISDEDCRKHCKEYALVSPALRDPQHALVKASGVSKTPEVAVLSASGVVRYRGRIDNRFPSLGVRRPAPTQSDLRNVLDAILANKRLPAIQTQAIGCFIE
ncbi:MAG: hypothetical protein ACI8W8_001310 [Rhodothermales bacterium]|jgi:hypothetical protein